MIIGKKDPDENHPRAARVDSEATPGRQGRPEGTIGDPLWGAGWPCGLASGA